jgi:UDP-N-acetylmuramoyl-tripeptide--D-alanyl-D-alanine ligase
MGERCKGRKIITFGRDKDADIRLVSLSQGLPSGLSVEITDGKNTVCMNTRFAGSRWVMAILAAIAGARAAGIDLSDCKSAIENHNPEFNRDSIHLLPDGTTFVLDCWKASLSTIPTSIEIVKHARAVRKTMIVGTISDYRGSSGSKYRNTAKAALGSADKVIFYGPNSDRVRPLIKDFPDRLHIFHHIEELRAHLLQDAVSGELVYIKAAGVDRLERLLLDRLEPISCWLEKCGRNSTCINCKFLYGTRGRAKRVMKDFRL